MILTKNHVLSALLIVVAFSIVNRLIPPSVDAVIAVTLSKNKDQIKSIDQDRNITTTKELMIDVVDLAEKNRFSHPVLGILGWGENFFADIKTNFEVKKSGRYRFEVGSDDGFELKIDEKSLCLFKGDRPFKKRVCNIQLEKGEHTLHLSYFQGYGNAGLTLKYADSPTSSLRFWGKSSNAILYIQ